MDQQRNLPAPTRRTEALGPSSVEPEPESPLLQEARDWLGAAREAAERIEIDHATDVFGTRRRNGPGQ
jgi:hypothetical protein